MIDICVCTFNPRPEILDKVLKSILNQTVATDTFGLLIVDNASSPQLSEDLLGPFKARGIPARIVRERIPGIARARLRGISETSGEWLLFVDDDNELMPEYIEEGQKFLASREDVGCFGGKLLLAPNLRAANWLLPFLPYLAIKDIGEEVVSGKGNSWGPWEPPTAGAFIKRSVLNLYKDRAMNDERLFTLGRKGKSNLSSCEDSLIMRGASMINLENAYCPRLILFHHLDSGRFNLRYLLRLMYSYGVSHVVLESLLGASPKVPEYYTSSGKFLALLFNQAKTGARQSIAFGIGLVAYHLGNRNECLRQNQDLL